MKLFSPTLVVLLVGLAGALIAVGQTRSRTEEWVGGEFDGPYRFRRVYPSESASVGGSRRPRDDFEVSPEVEIRGPRATTPEDDTGDKEAGKAT